MGTKCALCGEIVFKTLESKVKIIKCARGGHTVKTTKKQRKEIESTAYSSYEFKKND